MLDFKNKINYLKEELDTISNNYTDSFKTDIFFFFDDFSTSNSNLTFLKNLSSKVEISNWIDKLTSRILMKFDSQNEQINDFIYDYLELG
jgi:hypothetical protein